MSLASDELARRHRALQARIAGQTTSVLSRLLADLDPSDEYLAAYAPKAATVLTAQSTNAAALGSGYVLAAMGLTRTRPTRPLAAPVTDVAPDAPAVVAPVLSLRANLAEGVPYAEAVGLAHGVAAQRASRVLQGAMRAGADATSAAYPVRPRWSKTPDPQACDWCMEVAGESFPSADDVPSHDGDRCGVELVTE